MVVQRVPFQGGANLKSIETETWKAIPRLPLASTDRKACLVHIYPTGPGLGWLFPIENKPVSLGRGDDADISLNDASVSRRHACIQREGDEYCIVDQKSRNGTLVNDQIVASCRLMNGDLVRVGNQIFRFLAGNSIEADFHEEIYRLTISDPLTGIHNKRYLLEYLDRELARSQRYQRLLALIMFDLDQFKDTNDLVGHVGGDSILRELVRRFEGVIRKEELLARFGGEEFVVVLPETTPQGASEMAERLRLLVARQPFPCDNRLVSLTISLGIATAYGEPTPSPEELLRRADAKLYQAKRGGRNCVVQ